MNVSHSKPPLLSLNIKRTVDSLLTLNTSEQNENQSDSKSNQNLQNITKHKEEVQIDHSAEIKLMKEMLEQQCFEIVAYSNKIKDARRDQNHLLTQFHNRAEALELRLSSLTSTLLQKTSDMNQRIDSISKTLTPKPILVKLLPPNIYGRITGINAKMNLLAYTTALGYLIVIDRSKGYGVISENQPSSNEALFSPVIINRQDANGIFTVSSARKLFFATPAFARPKQICELKVESFSAITDSFKRENYDIVTGHHGMVNFYQFYENYGSINLIGSIKKLTGNVNHIVADTENEAIYCSTSRKFFYSISSSSYTLINSYQFPNMPLQIKLSTVFIIISFSPDDILILERNREKINILKKLTISGGLRYFYCGENQLFIITKKQQVERRRLCNPDENEIICEPDVADYDENEFIGTIFADDSKIYLSHNDRISVWT